MRLHTDYRHNVALASTTLMSRQMKALSIDSKVGNILAKAIAIRKAWCCIRNVSCVWFVCCAVHLLPRCSSQHSFLHQFHDHRPSSVGPTCLRALLCSSFLQRIARCATCFLNVPLVQDWRPDFKKINLLRIFTTQDCWDATSLFVSYI
jgi:hypothetical protein